MRKLFGLVFLMSMSISLNSQNVLSLDSCRALAISNNKDLQIAGEKINAAHYQKKAAFTNYFPEISAMGSYMRNQKEFSLLNDDQKSGLSNMGTAVQTQLQNGIQGVMQGNPSLAQNPIFMQMVGALTSIDLVNPLNAAGTSIVDAFRTDTRNVYAGAITLTQPLYMGGKIRAYNKITKYAEELARTQHNLSLIHI